MSTRIYSPETLLKMADNTLLGELFASFGIEIDSEKLLSFGSRECNFFLELFRTMPDDRKREFESVIQKIFDLACKIGLDALRSASIRCENEDWNNVYYSLKTPYYKAMYCWLHEREIFHNAVGMCKASACRWDCRHTHLPKIKPGFSEQIKNQLESKLENFLRENEKLEGWCTVEQLDKDRKTYYYAYMDKHQRDAVKHEGSRVIIPQVIKETFTVVLCYDHENGCSYLHTDGQKKFKQTLEKIFLDTLLPTPAPRPVSASYNLQLILDPRFKFNTNSEDHIRVWLTELTLIDDQSENSIRLHEKIPYWPIIRRWIQSQRLDMEMTTVKRIELSFVFYNQNGVQEKTITFPIGETKSTVLVNESPEYVQVITKYLTQWGLKNERHYLQTVEPERRETNNEDLSRLDAHADYKIA
ncbi:MAG: hypothetical protein PHQ75_13790 [Thermoguttaceae bacterium]|nr:hypothetical protein [Thermoguttaceae bacterium]